MSKRQINEDALLSAALDEFSSKSFEDASVNTIIRDARISKGSFYYRFKTKYDLYFRLLETGVQKKWEYIRANELDESAGDIFDRILLQARIGIEFARAAPRYHRLGAMFSREKGTSVYYRALKDLGQQDESGLEQTIRNAVSAGEIRDGFSDEFLQKLVPHLLTIFDEVFFVREEPDLSRSYKLLEQYVIFLRRGLAAL